MDTLLVYPNPFAAFDKDGHPCGVCPRDPDADAGGPGQFVGARLDNKKTQILQNFGKMAPHELRSPMQSTKYSYLGIASDDLQLAQKLLAKDPIVLPLTKFYRDRLIEGALIPADAAAAKSAGMRRFDPPASRWATQLAEKEAAAQPEAAAREGVSMPADGSSAPTELTAISDSSVTKKRSQRADNEA